MEFIKILDTESFSEEELNDINECVSNLMSTRLSDMSDNLVY